MNTDDMAYGGSGYPTGTDINGCVEAVEEEYNGKPCYITVNIPPLAGIYLMKVADPKPKKIEEKPAEKKPSEEKAPAKKTTTKKSPAKKAPAKKVSKEPAVKATEKKPTEVKKTNKK